MGTATRYNEPFGYCNRMAGYGAEPTPECPTDDAYDRRLMAVVRPTPEQLSPTASISDHHVDFPSRAVATR
jgi:hypothetical protein